MNFSSSELLLILAIVLVLFGSTRLPSLMEGMGKGIRSFKKAISGDDEVNLNPKERSLESKSAERVEIEASEVEGRRTR